MGIPFLISTVALAWVGTFAEPEPYGDPLEASGAASAAAVRTVWAAQDAPSKALPSLHSEGHPEDPEEEEHASLVPS